MLSTASLHPHPHHRQHAQRRLLGRTAQLPLDVFVLTVAFIVAYLLRFEFDPGPEKLRQMWQQLPLVLGVELMAMMLAGVYTFVWRYVGLVELVAFIKAGVLSGGMFVLARFALPENLGAGRIPLSIILMNALFAFAGTVALRVLRRVAYERHERKRAQSGTRAAHESVLLVGAGRAGVLAAKEFQSRGDLGADIRGFVDDDPEKQGAVIQSVRVLGTSRDIPQLVEELSITQVIITIAQASRSDIRRIVEICEQVPVQARIIPGYYEILDGRVEVGKARDVQIEDLLGREAVELDDDLIAEFIRGKTVMVTGAGGSIGSELARQVARHAPSRLLLVERAECALFEIHRELGRLRPGDDIVPVVADVGDEERMRAVFARHRPSVVFHAAAHKHVPMMEANPTEAVTNNVLGTWTAGRLAGEYGCDAFVLISTDKAVRPTSIMGASKRLAELVLQRLERKHATRYLAVRFGNVLGSAGSVIPIFREQILRGGPVTVTHPDMVRYFMTIPEATQLVLQAGAMGQGGEIFILDMGEPVRILDLAEDMISLSGFRPYEDIDIVFTGIRPGEKLFEELETVGEQIAKTRHPKIYIGTIAGYPANHIDIALARLRVLSAAGDEESLRAYLSQLLPEATLGASPTPPEEEAKGVGQSAPVARPRLVSVGA